ncbi:alpha/beta hydrolase [uncultured Microbulbifer sp.]|uniref:alpha/beta fold hydrolase n=1 Tax=uncultured Microbulbifer sp. TaxID=348147 RepID=UPI0026287836|nr:alpha/beta hydrolase [uncultured Microbulbifer sp.]
MKHSLEKPKETVLFLHGALADERMWEPHYHILSNEYRVVSLTQRHFGVNNKGSSGNFGIETHANDLISFSATLGEDPIHLIAWSYGADVALNATIKAPKLFNSLFIYEPGYPGHLNTKEMEEFMKDAEAMFGKVFEAVTSGEFEEAVAFLIDGSGNSAGYFSSQAPALRAQQLENAHTLPLQLSQTEKPCLDKEHLSKIQISTTIGYGSETRKLFQIVSKSAASHTPSSKLMQAASENHMLPIENPEKFCLLIKEHLSKN